MTEEYAFHTARMLHLPTGTTDTAKLTQKTVSLESTEMMEIIHVLPYVQRLWITLETIRPNYASKNVQILPN